MVRGLNFNLEFNGLGDFENSLKDMEKDLKRNLEQGMREYSLLAEEGSRALAHRDEGTLEASIEARLPIWVGDTLEASVSSNLAYALRRHEEPYGERTYDKNDAGVVEEDYYQRGLGRRSREKDTWRNMKPGRKFMSRAVDATEDEFEQIMAEALDKTLGGRR